MEWRSHFGIVFSPFGCGLAGPFPVGCCATVGASNVAQENSVFNEFSWFPVPCPKLFRSNKNMGYISMARKGHSDEKATGKRVPDYPDSAFNWFTDDFSTKLVWVIDRLGGLAKAAEIASASDETIANWRSGKTKPNFFGIVRLCQAAGVSVDWMAGQVAKNDIEASIQAVVDETPKFLDKMMAGLTLIPRLEVEASAGSGRLVQTEDAVETIAFRSEWLHRRGISPGAAKALTARGDSMEPTIRSGDILLVDTSKQRVEDNGIYVVVSSGLVLVKRIHPRPDGVITLISDNPVYPRDEIRLYDGTDFKVAGRVMWFGRSI